MVRLLKNVVPLRFPLRFRGRFTVGSGKEPLFCQRAIWGVCLWSVV